MKIDFKNTKITSIQEFLNQAESTSEKIFLFESCIEWYKQNRERRTELIEANEKFAEEIAVLKERLLDLGDLLKIEKRLDVEVQKFGDLATNNELDSQVKALKTGRIESVLNALKSFKNFIFNNNQNSESDKISIFEGKLVLYISLFMAFSSIGIFFLNQNLTSLFIGIVFVVLNLIIFSLVNKARYDEYQFLKTLSMSYREGSKTNYDDLIHKLNKHQQEFFVNAAWVNALRMEKENIQEVIQNRLLGVPLEKVEKLIEEKEMAMSENERMLDSITNNSISAEDYLEIRRELDILKIESDDVTESDFFAVEIFNLQSLENQIASKIKFFLDNLSSSAQVVIQE